LVGLGGLSKMLFRWEIRTSMRRRPLITAGVLLGVGLGGFIDGILFHQILQLHNMLSARLPPDTLANAHINMFWDGLFHCLTWLATVLGIAALWSAGARADVPWSGRTLIGGMLIGWGAFNFIEGVIDHHILGIHHVVERLGLSAYDYAFDGSGVLIALIGWWLVHGARLDPPARANLAVPEGLRR
jgi:uncharacterized membrane protein